MCYGVLQCSCDDFEQLSFCVKFSKYTNIFVAFITLVVELNHISLQLSPTGFSLFVWSNGTFLCVYLCACLLSCLRCIILNSGYCLIITTGNYCSQERCVLAQVWQKRKAQVLSISSGKCKLLVSFMLRCLFEIDKLFCTLFMITLSVLILNPS